MKVEFTSPKLNMSLTKPIFTIKYTDAHQIISTTNLFRFLYLYFRTLITKDKYLKISDKYSSILARPQICTTIINTSKSNKVGSLDGEPKTFEYCPTSPIAGQHILTNNEVSELKGIWENAGAVVGTAKFEDANETELPFPESMLSSNIK